MHYFIHYDSPENKVYIKNSQNNDENQNTRKKINLSNLSVSVKDIKKEAKSLMALFLSVSLIIKHTSEYVQGKKDSQIETQLNLVLSGFSLEYQHIFYQAFVFSRIHYNASPILEQQQTFLHNLNVLVYSLTDPKVQNLKSRLIVAQNFLFSVIDTCQIEETHTLHNADQLLTVNDIFRMYKINQKKDVKNDKLNNSKFATHTVSQNKSHPKNRAINREAEPLVVYYKPYQKNHFKLEDYNLFTDASVRTHEKSVSIGCVVSNEYEDLAVFRENLSYEHYFDNNLAECKAILEGLKIAHTMNIPTIKVFTDSTFAQENILALKANYQAPKMYHEVLNDIQRQLQLFTSYKIEHIHRHHNEKADKLASMNEYH